jgi:hypothetical protein
MDDEKTEGAEEPVIGDPPPAVVEAAPAVAPIEALENEAGRGRGLAGWLSSLLGRKR